MIEFMCWCLYVQFVEFRLGLGWIVCPFVCCRPFVCVRARVSGCPSVSMFGLA